MNKRRRYKAKAKRAAYKSLCDAANAFGEWRRRTRGPFQVTHYAYYERHQHEDDGLTYADPGDYRRGLE